MADADGEALFQRVLMAGVDRADVAFYREHAEAVDGPVLEVACGTGRVTLELLDAGIDVDGFDISAAALSVLRDDAESRGLDPTVWQADMRDFEVDREYALAYCPFNGFQHLLTVEDQLTALRAIHDVLGSDGRFVFEVFVPSFSLICEGYGTWEEQSISLDGIDYDLRTRTQVVDEVGQHLRVENELREAGRKRYESSHRITMLPPQHVELLGRQSPFSEWSVSGTYDGNNLEDGHPKQVWTFEV